MSIRQRSRSEKIARILIYASVGIFVLLFLSILVSVIIKGLPAFSLDIILKMPEGGFYLGREGGVLNAIIGSLMVAGGATVLALIISLPLVLFVNTSLKKGSRLAFALRFALDVLWGIPSIVYGACGVAVMLIAGLPASLLAGICVVTLVEMPVLARAIDTVLAMVPRELQATSYALGATAHDVSFRVMLREIFPGVITAILLAFGRGIGDAAAVLFVAGFQDGIPSSFLEPVATLPLAIFFQVNTAIPAVKARGYASGLVLMIIILVISFVARLAGRRLGKWRIRR